MELLVTIAENYLENIVHSDKYTDAIDYCKLDLDPHPFKLLARQPPIIVTVDLTIQCCS